MRKTKTAKAEPKARPADADIARKLHGTGGRLFVREPDGRWRDTGTGTVGARAELEQSWLAGLGNGGATDAKLERS